MIYNARHGRRNFVAHHQPFNYFARFAPGTDDRARHLKDYTDLVAAIDEGTLPQVAFYKPQGSLNEHPGLRRRAVRRHAHRRSLAKIKASPLWASTAIIVTYDENGGFWDHVPPPKGDRWGPGTRIPAIIVSPLAKKGYVDHTPYDTTSILKFITLRFGLEPLPGVRPGAGDLTAAFDLGVDGGTDRFAGVPRGVWVLGIVSLCMDMSSELVHALLPLYMATVMGASTLVIGVVEGIAEATALIVKLFSGILSDWFRKRKPLVLLGYGLAAVSKFAFPLAPTLGWIVGARFADRVGKGIRGAPRDALIADITPADARGRSFGLRQALDTVGGIGGPLLALAAMAFFASNFQAAFWIAVVPAMLCVLLIVVGVDEPEQKGRRRPHPGTVCVSPTSGDCRRDSGSSWRSPACSRSRDSPKRFWCCARRTWASPSRMRRWSWW